MNLNSLITIITMQLCKYCYPIDDASKKENKIIITPPNRYYTI